MGCCGIPTKVGRKKKRRKAHGATPSLERASTNQAQDGFAKSSGPAALGSSHVGPRLDRILTTCSGASDDENAYFDAMSQVSGGSPKGPSPPEGVSPPGSTRMSGSGQCRSDDDGDSRDGIQSPFAFLLGRAFPSLRRNTSSRPSRGINDSSDNIDAFASMDLDDGRVPSDAVIEPEGGGLGCLPRLPLGSPSSPRRYIRTLKPQAGSSIKLAVNGSVAGIEEYQEADSTKFMVRSKNYMKSKVKEPSQPAIYRLIGCDIYSFEFKLNHIGRHVQLPEPPRLGPAAQALPPHQRIPPLLVFNVQLPTYPPSFFGTPDGPGQSLVYYFALPEGWEPSQVENPAALGLLERFVHNGRESDATPTRDRLKLIARVANPEEWAHDAPLSMAETKLLNNYNDKPLLTRPQQKFFHGHNYMEVDIDVHSYAYLARKAFAGFIPRLTTVVFENAFVIQGNRPEELPEVVLAAARVARVNFEQVRPFPARMERTASNNMRLTPLHPHPPAHAQAGLSPAASGLGTIPPIPESPSSRGEASASEQGGSRKMLGEVNGEGPDSSHVYCAHANVANGYEAGERPWSFTTDPAPSDGHVWAHPHPDPHMSANTNGPCNTERDQVSAAHPRADSRVGTTADRVALPPPIRHSGGTGSGEADAAVTNNDGRGAGRSEYMLRRGNGAGPAWPVDGASPRASEIEGPSSTRDGTAVALSESLRARESEGSEGGGVRALVSSFENARRDMLDVSPRTTSHEDGSAFVGRQRLPSGPTTLSGRAGVGRDAPG